MTKPFNDRTEIINGLLDEVIEEAIQYHRDPTSGETFPECMLCGEWDDHLKECPIPRIETWFKIVEKKDAQIV
jgi:hypothetical protein